MLATVGHARLQQAVHQALGQQRHHARVAVEGAVADDAAARSTGLIRMVEVEHGREGKVHAAGAQFAGEHIARRGGRVGGGERAAALPRFAVLHPQLAKGAHGRQLGEAVAAKALHAPAFVVHADQQVVTHRLDGTGQCQQLGAVLPVAGKQDHAAGQGVGQTAAVHGRQGGTGDVKNEGCVFCHGARGLIAIYLIAISA